MVTQALAYLVEGGVDNLRELAAFLGDTVLLDGDGLRAAAGRCRSTGCTSGRRAVGGADVAGPRPVVGIVFYRAHELSGNTAFVDGLCEAIAARGGEPLPIFCGSLRGLSADDPDGADLLELLRGATSWSPPCWPPAARSPRPPAPAARTRPGTPGRWPRWTSRSCRAWR